MSLVLNGMHVQLGNASATVAALGTVATLAALAVGRRRDKARERRMQAEAISGWWEGEITVVESDIQNGQRVTKMSVLNRSDAPVYGVLVTLAFIRGAAPRSADEWLRTTDGVLPYSVSLGSLPPGQWYVTVDSGWGAAGARPGVEVAFTDKSGVHWVRRARGQLEKLKVPLDQGGMMSYDVPKRDVIPN